MNKFWEEEIRQKLAQHEEAAPELSWAEIDKALKARQQQQPHTIPLWGRRTAAAAAIAAAIAGVTTVLLQQQTDIQQPSSTSLSSPTVCKDSKTSDRILQKHESVYMAQQLPGQAQKIFKNNNRYAKETVNEVEETSTLHQEVLPPSDEKQEKEPAKEQTEQISHEPRVHKYRNLYDDEPVELGRHKPQAKLSVTTFFAGNMGRAVGEDVASLASSPSFKGIPMLTSGRLQEYHSAHHRLPIRTGLGVSYQLAPKWSVSTGLSYTYLHSDIFNAIGSDATTTYQRLHYLGIPLQVNYSLWSNRNLNVYVSGGGMAEKMIKGEADIETSSRGNVTSKTSQDVSMHQLQWSVNGSVGVEYTLFNKIAVYAEPGVSYYFDNGSNVETIYDDKPFNFSLNIGLRLNIK